MNQEDNLRTKLLINLRQSVGQNIRERILQKYDTQRAFSYDNYFRDTDISFIVNGHPRKGNVEYIPFAILCDFRKIWNFENNFEVFFSNDGDILQLIENCLMLVCTESTESAMFQKKIVSIISTFAEKNNYRMLSLRTQIVLFCEKNSTLLLSSFKNYFKNLQVDASSTLIEETYINWIFQELSNF